MAPEPLIIVQARLGSKRLPGKVLKEIKGKPLLGYLLDRLPFDNVVVATPDQQIADFVWDYADDAAAFVWDGPEDDVAGRFAACLDAFDNPPTFVRLCADSPLMDPALIEAAMTLYAPSCLSVTTPVGCAQVVDRKAWDEHGIDREHVIAARRCPTIVIHPAWPRLVVDTADDFARVSAVIEKMTEPHWTYGWREVCALL